MSTSAPILRQHRTSTSLPNKALYDPRLSQKAHGILAQLIGKPDNWKFDIKDFCRYATDGEDATRAGLRELRNFGYVSMIKISRGRGHFQTIWDIYPDPALNSNYQKSLGLSRRGFTDTINPDILLVPNNESVGGTKTPTTETKGEGFFGKEEEYPPFIRKACGKLEDWLRLNRRITNKRINRQRWYEDMRLLLQDLKGDKGQLKRVLRIYITNPHDKYTPVVESPSAFRAKFVRIAIWANELESPKPKPTITEEVVYGPPQ